MAGLSVIFKAIDEISDKLDAMSSAGNKTLDAFDKLSDTADKAFANTTEETQKATEAMEKAAQATDYWTDAVGNYDKGCLEAVYSTEELVNMGFKTEDALKAEADAAEEAQDKTEQLGEEMDKTSKKSEDFGDKSKNAVVGLDDILATVGIVAALNKIADAFSNASDKAAEFETNVAMVSTVADTTVLSADQLATQISGLSKDTAKNVNELADATYNAISAGVATEGAVETVGEASKLATAGFTSSASALSVLTTALNAYQLEASEVTNISDSLITSQNLGVMTIDQLSSSMGKAISTASAYSIDLYNLESGYISLTKAGVSVEESTTYISSMFNELGDSGSEVAGVIMEETGQSFGQLMKSGYSLADVLEILYNSVDQDSEALMNLWGSAEAGKAANAVINQGLDTFNTNLDKLRNSAEAEFNRVEDTIRECYEQMGYSEEEIDSMMAELALASATATEASEIYEQQREVLESTSDGYDEASSVIQGYSAQLEELCTAYDDAYDSALQSVQGQYDLWTEVEDVTAMTSQSIKDALQSQIDYWNSYNENMNSLTARADEIEGLSDMLKDLSDGSEESAAMLAGMESMNDADLSAVVKQYNDLQTAQGDTATSMAELETDFSDSLTKIQTDMETAVDNLNLSDEAKANAKSTMDAYVQEIQNGVAKAQKAIDSLSFANTTLKGGGYHAYAEGTVDAEPGLALVGEEGPELVNFGGGEVVYTADETANILAKDTSSDSFYVEPEQAVNDTAGGDRTVTFRVEGAGEMKVTGNGVTKEDVVSLLMSNMKDALMGIIQQEIEEEGDLSYEF